MRIYAKFVSVIVLSAFFISSVCRDFAYALTTPENQAILLQKIEFPSAIGKITDFSYTGSSDIFINIQDLHCNPEVQKNLSLILDELCKKLNINRVFLEGGSGRLDFSSFENINDDAIRDAVTESLLASGKLTGTEYFALKSKIEVYGIEDGQVYNKNLQNLLYLQNNSVRMESAVSDLKKRVVSLEEQYLSGTNLKLNKYVDQYRKSEISSKKFYSLLKKQIDKINLSKDLDVKIDLGSYPQINAYLAYSQKRDSVNDSGLSKEISAFADELKTLLSYKEYSAFISETDNFRNSEALFAKISRMSAGKTIDISKYKNISSAAVSFEFLKKLNPVSLIYEENVLINEIKIADALNADECNVIYLSYMTDLLSAMLANKLSYAEFKDFNYKSGEFYDVLKLYLPEYDLTALRADVKIAEEFYLANSERNRIFIDNINKFDNGKNKIHVVVTGGYHSAGLKELLSAENVSFVQITPYISGSSKKFEDVYKDVIAERTYADNNAFAPIPLVQTKKDTLINTFLETYKDFKFKDAADTEKFVKTMTDFINAEVSKDIPGYSVSYKIYEDKFEIIYPDGLVKEFKQTSFNDKNKSKMQTYFSRFRHVFINFVLPFILVITPFIAAANVNSMDMSANAVYETAVNDTVVQREIDIHDYPSELISRLAPFSVHTQLEYRYDDATILHNDKFKSVIDSHVTQNPADAFLNDELVRYSLAVFIRNNIEYKNSEFTEENILRELDLWFRLYKTKKDNVLIDNNTHLININADERWPNGGLVSSEKSLLSILDSADINIAKENIENIRYNGSNKQNILDILSSIKPGKKYFITLSGHGLYSQQDETYRFFLSGGVTGSAELADYSTITISDKEISAILIELFKKGVNPDDITLSMLSCYSDHGAKLIMAACAKSGFAAPNIIVAADDVHIFSKSHDAAGEGDNNWHYAFRNYLRNNKLNGRITKRDVVASRTGEASLSEIPANYTAVDLDGVSVLSNFYPSTAAQELSLLNEKDALNYGITNIDDRFDKAFNSAVSEIAQIYMLKDDDKAKEELLQFKNNIFHKLKNDTPELNSRSDFRLKIAIKRICLELLNNSEPFLKRDVKNYKPMKSELRTAKLYNFSKNNHTNSREDQNTNIKYVNYIKLVKVDGNIYAELESYGSKKLLSSYELYSVFPKTPTYKKIIFDTDENAEINEYAKFVDEFFRTVCLSGKDIRKYDAVLTKGFAGQLMGKNIDLNKNDNTPKTVKNISAEYSQDNLHYIFEADPLSKGSFNYEDPVIRNFKYSSTNFQRFWIQAKDLILYAFLSELTLLGLVFVFSTVTPIVNLAIIPMVIATPFIHILIYAVSSIVGKLSVKIKQSLGLRSPHYEKEMQINKNLKIVYDETLKKDEFFEADRENNMIKANKRIFDIYNSLPVPATVKNIILLLSGAVSHEIKHLLGKGEFFAYAFQFGIPAAGIAAGWLISSLLSISFMPFAIILPALFVFLDYVMSKRALKNSQIESIHIESNNSNDAAAIAKSMIAVIVSSENSVFEAIPIGKAEKEILINKFLQTYKDIEFKELADVEKFVNAMTDFINEEVSKEISGYSVSFKMYNVGFEIIYPNGKVKEFYLPRDFLRDNRFVFEGGGEFMTAKMLTFGVVFILMTAALFLSAYPFTLNVILIAAFFLPTVFMPSIFYLISKFFAFSSGVFGKLFNLEKPSYQNEIQVGRDFKILYDNDLQDGQYFEADVENKTIKANKQIFDIYNNIPAPAFLKKFILHISGIVGFEAKLLAGKSEQYAYWFLFGAPVAGIISAVTVSSLFALGFVPLIFLMVALPVLFIILDSVPVNDFFKTGKITNKNLKGFLKLIISSLFISLTIFSNDTLRLYPENSSMIKTPDYVDIAYVPSTTDLSSWHSHVYRGNKIIPEELDRQLKTANVIMQPEYIYDDISIYNNEIFNSVIDKYISVNQNEASFKVPLIRYYLAVYVRNNIEFLKREINGANIESEVNKWFENYDFYKDKVLIDKNTNIISIHANDRLEDGEYEFADKGLKFALHMGKIDIPGENWKSVRYNNSNKDEIVGLLGSLKPGKKYLIVLNGHGEHSKAYDFVYILGADKENNVGILTAEELTGIITQNFDNGVKPEDLTLCIQSCYSDYGAKLIIDGCIKSGYSSPNVITVADNIQPLGIGQISLKKNASVFVNAIAYYFYKNNYKGAFYYNQFMSLRLNTMFALPNFFPSSSGEEYAELNPEDMSGIGLNENLTSRLDKIFDKAVYEERFIDDYPESSIAISKPAILNALQTEYQDLNEKTDLALKILIKQKLIAGNVKAVIYNLSETKISKKIKKEHVFYVRLEERDGVAVARVKTKQGYEYLSPWNLASLILHNKTNYDKDRIILDVDAAEKDYSGIYGDFFDKIVKRYEEIMYVPCDMIMTKGLYKKLLNEKGIDLTNMSGNDGYSLLEKDVNPVYFGKIGGDDEISKARVLNEERHPDDSFKHRWTNFKRFWINSRGLSMAVMISSMVFAAASCCMTVFNILNPNLFLLFAAAPFMPVLMYFSSAFAGKISGKMTHSNDAFSDILYEKEIRVIGNLKIVYDDNLKKGEFFEADRENNIIKANKRIFEIYNSLPVPAAVKNIILLLSGAVSHEIKHLIGKGELFAYALQFGIPAAGIAAAWFVSFLSGISFAPLAIVFPVFFVFLDFLLSKRAFKNVRKEMIIIASNDLDEAFVINSAIKLPNKLITVKTGSNDKNIISKLNDSVFLCYDKEKNLHYLGFSDENASATTDSLKLILNHRMFTDELNKASGGGIKFGNAAVLAGSSAKDLRNYPYLDLGGREDIQTFSGLSDGEQKRYFDAIKALNRASTTSKLQKLSLKLNLSSLTELTDKEISELIKLNHAKGIYSLKITADKNSKIEELSEILNKIRSSENNEEIKQATKIYIEPDFENAMLLTSVSSLKKFYIDDIIVNLSSTKWASFEELSQYTSKVLSSNTDFLVSFRVGSINNNIEVGGKRMRAPELNKLSEKEIFTGSDIENIIVIPSTFGSLKGLLREKRVTLSKLYSGLINNAVNAMRDDPQTIFNEAMLLDSSYAADLKTLKMLTDTVYSNDVLKKYLLKDGGLAVELTQGEADAVLESFLSVKPGTTTDPYWIEYKKLLETAARSKNKDDLSALMAFFKGMVYAGLENAKTGNERFENYEYRLLLTRALANLSFSAKSDAKHGGAFLEEIKADLKSKSSTLTWSLFQTELADSVKKLRQGVARGDPETSEAVIEILLLYCERQTEIKVERNDNKLDLQNIKMILVAA